MTTKVTGASVIVIIITAELSAAKMLINLYSSILCLGETSGTDAVMRLVHADAMDKPADLTRLQSDFLLRFSFSFPFYKSHCKFVYEHDTNTFLNLLKFFQNIMNYISFLCFRSQ